MKFAKQKIGVSAHNKMSTNEGNVLVARMQQLPESKSTRQSPCSRKTHVWSRRTTSRCVRRRQPSRIGFTAPPAWSERPHHRAVLCYSMKHRRQRSGKKNIDLQSYSVMQLPSSTKKLFLKYSGEIVLLLGEKEREKTSCLTLLSLIELRFSKQNCSQSRGHISCSFVRHCRSIR